MLALAACVRIGDQDPTALQGAAVPGRCPQPRDTEAAPDLYQALRNPLADTAENLDRGRRLYQEDARPAACVVCHGIKGDGQGPLARGLAPPPRNFTCAATMNALGDGQLFWIIERGSGTFHVPPEQGAQRIERPGRGRPFTAMGGYKDNLDETDIWSLILYLRTFAARR
jgi:cytochrome c553